MRAISKIYWYQSECLSEQLFNVVYHNVYRTENMCVTYLIFSCLHTYNVVFSCPLGRPTRLIFSISPASAVLKPPNSLYSILQYY